MRGPRLVAHFREHSGNVAEDRKQEQVRQITQKFNAMPFSQGIALTIRYSTVAGADGYAIVNHGLGVRAGFFSIHCRDGIIEKVFESSDQTGLDPLNQMRIGMDIVDGDPVVVLWFYPSALVEPDVITGIGR